MPVPTITTLPDFPVRGEDPTTFAEKANDSVAAYPTMVTQMNTMGEFVEDEAAAAEVSRIAAEAAETGAEAQVALAEAQVALAEAAADAAAAASNAEQWVSGQAYVTGEVVWSPINFKSYRANTNTSGTTDPSLSASWTPLSVPLPLSIANGGTGSTSTTFVNLASNVTGTLPTANGGTGLSTLGTAGQALRVNSGGTALEYGTISAGITNVVTATSSTTLTSTPTLLRFAPTAPCQKITLPNATTMAKGANVFAIQMEDGFPAMIVDNGGNILGWTRRNSDDDVLIHLLDNTTSNGVWGLDGVEYWGLEASGEVTFASKIDTSTSVYTSSIELDSNKTLILASNSNLQAVVYDKSTNTFGTAVLVRNAGTISNFYSGLISSSSVLVVSAANTNDMQGVVLSISGTTITVNTAGTLTLTGGGHLSMHQGYRALVAFGTSWLYLGNSASAGAVIPISVSGTTVTFGTPVATTGLQVAAIYAVTSSVALVFSQNSNSTIYAECFTVSGSTATKNSQVTITSNLNGFTIEQIGSRWAVAAVNSTVLSGNIISVAGTVPSVSSVTLVTGTGQLDSSPLAYHRVGNQLIFGVALSQKAYINVLTDNAGTAVAGTQILIGTGSTALFYYIGGSATEGWWRNLITTSENYGCVVTISGNNPVLSTLWRSTVNTSTAVQFATPSTIKLGTPFATSTLMYTNTRAINPQPGQVTLMGVEKGMIAFENTSLIQNNGTNRMLTNSEVWVVATTENANASAGTSTKYLVQKVRVV